jgi:hypothetical protein
MFELYFVIKQIITKNIIIFFEQDEWPNIIKKVNDDNKENGGSTWHSGILTFLPSLLSGGTKED